MRFKSLFVFLFILLNVLASIYLIMPHHFVTANAPESSYSAERSRNYIAKMAQKPHPIGSHENKRIRNYLLEQLQSKGLDAHISHNELNYAIMGNTGAANTYNVLGRLKGTDTSAKAVLITAHYDSQINTPGACDDISGVGSILECLDVLKARQSELKNDLIVLFSDGEEFGLYGARSFVLDQHPWLKDVGFVINLEGRGNYGPSLAFEFGNNNGKVIRDFIDVVPYPLANSIMVSIYKKMPNGTDFSLYRNADIPGVNNALLMGLDHYHSSIDRPEDLNLGSLQQHGENALAMIEHFGNTDLDELKADDAVFFNLFGYYAVSFDLIWNYVLFAIASLLLIYFIWKNWKEIKTDLPKGFLHVILSIPFIVIGNLLIHFIITVLFEKYTFGYNGTYNADYFFALFAALTTLLFALYFSYFQKKQSYKAHIISFYVIIYVLSLALILYIPYGAHMTVIPLLLALVGSIAKERTEFVSYLLLIPIISISIPFFIFLFGAADVVISAIPILFLILFIGLLGNVLFPLFKGNKHAILLCSGIILYALLIIGIKSEHSSDQPLRTDLSYFIDKDNSKAYWISTSADMDDWKIAFLPMNLSHSTIEDVIFPSKTALSKEVNMIDIQGINFNMLKDSISDAKRQIQLEVTSNPDAIFSSAIIYDTTITSIGLNNHTYPMKNVSFVNGGLQIKNMGLPDSKSYTLFFTADTGHTILIRVDDCLLPLTDYVKEVVYPDYMIPEPFHLCNLISIKQSFEIPASKILK